MLWKTPVHYKIPMPKIAIKIKGFLHPEIVEIKGAIGQGQIIVPFLQNYQYRINSIKPFELIEPEDYTDKKTNAAIFQAHHIPGFDFLVNVEPHCDNAKEVFKRQYGNE